jgi:cytochrome c553
MMHTKYDFMKIIVIAFCYLLLSTVANALDGDREAGRVKFSTCRGCHAVPGYNNVYPTYHVPRLAGQNPDYVLAALKEYKSGERTHPTMHANSYNLSEEDMADIAVYLGSLDLPAETQPVKGNVAAGKEKAASCAACHGMDGNGNPDDPASAIYPRLAGQYEDYLRKVLREYNLGKRQNAIMNGMAAPLSEQDQADLAAYFASLPKGLSTAK